MLQLNQLQVVKLNATLDLTVYADQKAESAMNL